MAGGIGITPLVLMAQILQQRGANIRVLFSARSEAEIALTAWAHAGKPRADLRYETFGSCGCFAPQAFRLQVPRHKLDITVEAQTSLLETLDSGGIRAMYGCRRGECGLCAMNVLALDGEIDHSDVFLSEHEKTANQRMCVCVSRVLGSVTLESAYRLEA